MGREMKERPDEQISFAINPELYWAERTLCAFNGQNLSERMRMLVEQDVGKHYSVLLKEDHKQIFED